jgi:hypothetical protein
MSQPEAVRVSKQGRKEKRTMVALSVANSVEL